MNTAMQADFDAFWQVYPRRIGKLAAMKAYEKARKLATAEQILAGVEAYRQHKPGWQEWKHPGPWLNAGRYLDEYETTPAPVERAKPDWWDEAMAAAKQRQADATQKVGA